MGTSFVPPAELKFSIGSDDRDVSLDELLKSYSKHRLPNKSRKRLSKSAARSARQKCVASRQSALRQGKFAEFRCGDGSSDSFRAVKAAGVKALSVPVVGKNKKLKTDEPRYTTSKLLKMLKKQNVKTL